MGFQLFLIEVLKEWRVSVLKETVIDEGGSMDSDIKAAADLIWRCSNHLTSNNTMSFTRPKFHGGHVCLCQQELEMYCEPFIPSWYLHIMNLHFNYLKKITEW